MASSGRRIGEEVQRPCEKHGRTCREHDPAYASSVILQGDPLDLRFADAEAHILEHPDDSAGYLVYADLLTAQGSSLGELIVVQHALSLLGPDERQSERARRLAAREAELIAEHDPLAGMPRECVQARWRWGTIESIRVHNPAALDDEIDAPAMLQRVVAAPAAAVLRELELGILEVDGHGFHNEGPITEALEAVGRSPTGPRLRRLVIGAVIRDFGGEAAMPYAIGDLSGISTLFPALRSLVVHGSFFHLGDRLHLPQLHDLAIETSGLPASELAAITGSDWLALERMSLWFGVPGAKGDCTLESVAPILDGTRWPALRHLGLMNAVFTDALCAAVADAPLLRQLESLDLSMGTMSAEGATALVGCAAALRHLVIDVSDNGLASEDVDRLRAADLRVVSRRQRWSRFGRRVPLSGMP
jgi:uncharacterized protein (TIGR02996 family)